MIQRPTDFTDFTAYSKLLTIWHNQQNQDAENATSHDNYVTAALSWITTGISQRDHGQPVPPPPVIPKYVTYNDDGTITYTDFPDLKPAVLPPVTAPGGTIVSPPTMDRTDAILMLVQSIAKKLGV